MSDMHNIEKNKRSAERLLDVIGMIDDSIIADAEKRPTRKSAFVFSSAPRRFVAVMAAVLVMITGIVGSFVIFDVAKEDSDFGNVTNAPEGIEGLEHTLLAATESGIVQSIASVSEIDFFDGVMSLIWQNESENEYYRVVFDPSVSKNELRTQLAKGTAQMNVQQAEAVMCKVWVSYGNGEVVSPYLKESAGNVGYAELFEYTPEVEPSQSFSEIVNRTIYN